jgi:hypothetical protein
MVWIDALLRSLGMFYAFAGVVAVRAGLQSALLDVALAAPGGGKPSRRERMQSLWLVGGAILIGWSGLALAILWDGALLLFLANAAVQAAYLGIAAPRYFDRDDPPDPAGRSQTRNAFYVYLAATAFVAAAAYGGRLVGLAEIPAAQSSLAAALALVGLLYALQQGIFPFGRSSREETLASNDTEVADEAIDLRSQRPPGELPGRILIMAEMDGWPTWEVHEISEGFDPAELALSPALAADLAAWAEAFNDSFDRDNPGAPRPWTEAQNAEHESRGRDLAIRVKQAMIDRGRGDIDVGYWTDAVGTIWLELSDLPPDSGAPNSASAG